MNFHTQCLSEVLMLCVIMFPSAYIYFLKPFVQIRNNTLLSENLVTVIVYGSLAVLGAATGSAGLSDAELFPRTGTEIFLLLCLLAVAAGGFNVAAEYTEAAIPILRRTGRLPAMRPAGIYRGSFSFVNFCSIIAAAALEEFAFRQFMMGGVLRALGMSLWPSILLSAFFYGMNHVYFGRFAVLQKFTSGLVFAALFAVSGGNLLPCILCHTAQNLILYFYAVTRREQKGARV